MNKENVQEENIEDVAGQKSFQGILKHIVLIIAVAFSVFQLWANSIGLITSMKHLGIFLSFILVLIFLLYPATKNMKNTRWYDFILAFLGGIVGLYMVFRIDTVMGGALQSNFIDSLMAGLAILLVLEATRRVIGMWLVVIPGIFIVYALFGNLIPGVFGHTGFTLERFLQRMYMLDGGLFGTTTRVAATYIFMFILFGAFLEQSGVGKFFNQLALFLTGRSSGGPAKVAVFSSGLMGSISGSAVANVATTGPFTIPIMKRVGFSRKFAGAVEAAASTGGVLAPPVMGSAAFLMAELLGIPYSEIMIAAIIPAVLYYVAIFIMVHLESKRLGLVGLPKNEIPGFKKVIKRSYLIIPLIVIVYAILSGSTPLYAATLGIISTFIVSQFSKGTRIGFRKLIVSLEAGAKKTLSVAIACTVAGIIVGTATMTGVGQVLAHNIILLSNNILFLALLLITVTVIFLSMGLPAAAAYIIVASIAAPALVEMGITPLAAHLFVFYFSALSNVTPPVALASYTAAGIAGANASDVAWTGIRLTLAGFIIPFLFVYTPGFLMIDATIQSLSILSFTALLGITALAVSIIGYLFGPVGKIVRGLFFVSSLLLINAEAITDIIGLIMIGVLIVWNIITNKQTKKDTLIHENKGYLSRSVD